MSEPAYQIVRLPRDMIRAKLNGQQEPVPEVEAIYPPELQGLRWHLTYLAEVGGGLMRQDELKTILDAIAENNEQIQKSVGAVAKDVADIQLRTHDLERDVGVLKTAEQTRAADRKSFFQKTRDNAVSTSLGAILLMLIGFVAARITIGPSLPKETPLSQATAQQAPSEESIKKIVRDALREASAEEPKPATGPAPNAPRRQTMRRPAPIPGPGAKMQDGEILTTSELPRVSALHLPILEMRFPK